jgi:hypothetical protein
MRSESRILALSAEAHAEIDRSEEKEIVKRRRSTMTRGLTASNSDFRLALRKGPALNF